MSAEWFWSLPVGGAGRRVQAFHGRAGVGEQSPLERVGLTDLRAGQFDTYDEALQVARAAEVAGFAGLFIPWHPAGEDTWILASSLARHTRRLVLLPEIQIPFATPVYLAKMSASFQRLAQGRLGFSFDLARSESVRRAHGDALPAVDVSARADEYLEAAHGVWTQRPYGFRGLFYDVEAGGFEGPLSGLAWPEVYTAGESDGALSVAAKHADVHVLGSSHELHARLARAKAALGAQARPVKLGLRLSVLARHTQEEASRDAQGSEIDLVGSYAGVAERLLGYVELGVERLILEARPAVDEAYRFGEHVLPRLRPSTDAASRGSA